MMPGLASMLGCGLMLAGLAADGFVARRWLAAGRPAPLDTLAALAFVLPAAGLVLMVTLAA